MTEITEKELRNIQSITPDTVFELSREGYRLMQLGRDTKGRTLRRFLSRVAFGNNVAQVFCYEDGYSATQLNAIEKYAAEVAETCVEHMPKEAGFFKTTFQESSYGMVQNVYALNFPIATASVSELISMVKMVTVLSDTMHRFRANPNNTALIGCADYVYRGRGMDLCDAPWFVAGADARGGSGILEWCFDEADAKEVMGEMSKHDRFKSLRIDSWEREMLRSSAVVQ